MSASQSFDEKAQKIHNLLDILIAKNLIFAIKYHKKTTKGTTNV